jgi:hypothetical protein
MSVRASVVTAMLATAGCYGGGDDVPRPHLATLVPTRGSPGHTFTMLGDHLCAIPEDHDGDEEPAGCESASGSVLFGPGVADTVSWSTTAIVAIVPAGTSPRTVAVRVAVGGLISNSLPFEVVPLDGIRR